MNKNKILTADLSIKNSMWSQDGTWVLGSFDLLEQMGMYGHDSLAKDISASIVEKCGHKLSSSQLDHVIQIKGEFILEFTSRHVINVTEGLSLLKPKPTKL